MSNSSNVWKLVAIAAICVIAVESVCYGMGVGWKDKSADNTDSKSEPAATTAAAKEDTPAETTTTAAEDEPSEEAAEPQETADGAALTLWTDDAPAKQQLTEYMAAITAEGSEEKAQKMYDLCEEFDWVPISMKNDWTTIYGDGVTYIKE